jgi:hypothetical protein
VERGFLTDQDRLIKELRLAKVETLSGANEFLEKEYWPEWNAKFTRPARGPEDLHRPLAEDFELGSTVSLSSTGGDHQQLHVFLLRQAVSDRPGRWAGMKRQRVRVELWLNGELQARYAGRYRKIGELCRPTAAGAATVPAPSGVQGSRCGRQEPLDGGILESAEPALVEGDRRPMNGTPSRRRGRWCAGKVRPAPSNAPHGRILRGPDCKPIKERLRRSLRRHSAPPRAHNIRAPGLRFLRHDGIHRSDVVEFTTKPWGRDRAASRRSAPSPGNRTRREDCALLIVPDEFRPGYFSIRLVATRARLGFAGTRRLTRTSPVHTENRNVLLCWEAELSTLPCQKRLRRGARPLAAGLARMRLALRLIVARR